MDAQEMKDTARRWLTGIFDNADFSLIEAMTADGYTFHIARPGTLDAAALPEVITAFRTAFPDLNNTIEEQIVEGNVVVTRGTTHGTHQGPLGDLSATGKTVATPWVVFTRFDGDRIVQDWEVWDELGLMMQIGAIPESG